MNQSELRTELLENLDDLGVTFYTPTDVTESIKDAYDNVALLTGCITKGITIPNVGQPYWNLKTLVPDYLYPLGIYNYATNEWLSGRSLRFLDSIRWDWELWNGQPRLFSPIDFNRIAVAPHLSTGTGVMTLIYRASPEDLTDSSIFFVPQVTQQILFHYGMMDLLEQSKEYQEARVHQEAYFRLIEPTKSAIKRLAESDKMRVMQPYMPLPRFGPGSGSGDTSMFIDNEIPAGTVNGINAVFTLQNVPSPSQSLVLTRNGTVLYQGVGYVLSGGVITFNSGYIPLPPSGSDTIGDLIRAWYRVA